MDGQRSRLEAIRRTRWPHPRPVLHAMSEARTPDKERTTRGQWADSRSDPTRRAVLDGPAARADATDKPWTKRGQIPNLDTWRRPQPVVQRLRAHASFAEGSSSDSSRAATSRRFAVPTVVENV